MSFFGGGSGRLSRDYIGEYIDEQLSSNWESCVERKRGISYGFRCYRKTYQRHASSRIIHNNVEDRLIRAYDRQYHGSSAIEDAMVDLVEQGYNLTEISDVMHTSFKVVKRILTGAVKDGNEDRDIPEQGL